MHTSPDHAFLPEHRDALTAVDLHLFGVRHGVIDDISGPPHVSSCDDADYENLLAATDELSVERGDVLAVESTGFARPFAKDLTLTTMIPDNVPNTPPLDGPVSSPVFQGIVTDFLESARQKRHINPLVYAASRAILRGLTVHRADAQRMGLQFLQEVLRHQDPATRSEAGIYYRNTCMLKHLGDISLDMKPLADGSAPVLLFASGYVHPARLVPRLLAAKVPFRATISPNLDQRLLYPQFHA